MAQGGTVQKANLGIADQEKLVTHLGKHKTYPVTFRFSKPMNAGGVFIPANFPNVDGALGRYYTETWTPKEITGVVSISANFILRQAAIPLGGSFTFAIFVSYKSTVTTADNGNPDNPDDVGGDIYELLQNAGETGINDFQVDYPMAYYVARNQPLYIHYYVPSNLINSAQNVLFTGRVTLGCLTTGA